MQDYMDYLKNLVEKENLDFEEMVRSVSERLNLADVVQTMQVEQEKMGRYLQMTARELAALEDTELCEAVYTRLCEQEEVRYVPTVFLVVWEYLQEMENGGLCQYFVNTNPQNAPMLAEALQCIGAESHGELFQNFCGENGIDPEDLSEFEMDYDGDWKADYARLCEQLPFESYDAEFWNLPDVRVQLVQYVRENIDQF